MIRSPNDLTLTPSSLSRPSNFLVRSLGHRPEARRGATASQDVNELRLPPSLEEASPAEGYTPVVFSPEPGHRTIEGRGQAMGHSAPPSWVVRRRSGISL